MEIKPIHKNTAIPFIQQYHYSKILPRLTKWYLGYYEGDSLVGVITLGWGTQPLQTIQKIFYKDDVITTDYFEIGKMELLSLVRWILILDSLKCMKEILLMESWQQKKQQVVN